MSPPKRALVEKATNVLGIPKAFRPNPLSAEEMEFYSESLNLRRGNQLQRKIRDELLESVEQGTYFKGVLYGNRGAGKSTEINRLLELPAISNRFVVVKLDALDQLNPQTWSVADLLLLLAVALVECEGATEPGGENPITRDLQQQLSPFFPELQTKFKTLPLPAGTPKSVYGRW